MLLILRTYRTVPALAALLLLLGVFLPVVQEVCAMNGPMPTARMEGSACCCPAGHPDAPHVPCGADDAHVGREQCCVQAQVPRQPAAPAPLPLVPGVATLVAQSPLFPDAPPAAPPPLAERPAPSPPLSLHLLFSALLI